LAARSLCFAGQIDAALNNAILKSLPQGFECPIMGPQAYNTPEMLALKAKDARRQFPRITQVQADGYVVSAVEISHGSALLNLPHNTVTLCTLHIIG
jgi:hypothetical protein